MVVTRCGTKYAQYAGTRYLKSSSCSQAAVRNNGILVTEPVDIDGTVASDMGSYGVGSDSGSTGSFSLSSSTETHASSTYSADSNRTYVTQSSVCCKVDTLQDPQCIGLQRSYSGATEKSNKSVSQEQLNDNQISVNLIRTCATPELCSLMGQKWNGLKTKTSKRAIDLKLTRENSLTSEREIRIPRKRASYLEKNDQLKFVNHGLTSPVCSMNAQYVPNSFVEEENDPLELSYESNQVSKKFSGNDLCTTWSDIAKNGNQSRDYIVYNIHSNPSQELNTNLCSSTNISQDSDYKSAEKKSVKEKRELREVHSLAEDQKMDSEVSSQQMVKSCSTSSNLTELKHCFSALSPSQFLKPYDKKNCGTHYKEETLIIQNANFVKRHSISRENARKKSIFNKPFKDNLVHLPKVNVPKYQDSESAYPLFSSTCHGYKEYYPSMHINKKDDSSLLSKNPLQIKLRPLHNSLNSGIRYSCHRNSRLT